MTKYKWVVEIEIDEELIDYGFTLDNDDAREMLYKFFPNAHGSLFDAKVVQSPTLPDDPQP